MGYDVTEADVSMVDWSANMDFGMVNDVSKVNGVDMNGS